MCIVKYFIVLKNHWNVPINSYMYSARLVKKSVEDFLLFSKSLFSFPKLLIFVLNSNDTMKRNGLTSLKLLENSNDFMLYVQLIFDELFIVGNSNHLEMKSLMFIAFL